MGKQDALGEVRPEMADRLKRARVDRGFKTAKAAANYFGWNYNTYSQHERGIMGLRPEVAKKYAAAYRVPAGWLLTGESNDTLRQKRLGGSLLQADPESELVIKRGVLNQALIFVLRGQGVPEDLATELANIAIDCLSEPAIIALDSDPVRSFQVRFELESHKYDRLALR